MSPKEGRFDLNKQKTVQYFVQNIDILFAKCYHRDMGGIIISTDRLVPASEARNKFGKLLEEISKDEESYFVILENGKLAAVLVHPFWLKNKIDNGFPSLESLRSGWKRHSEEIGSTLKKLSGMKKKNLPPLLQ